MRDAVRTLCYRCKQNYIEAGIKLERDYSVKYKDTCDICGRLGWDYYIWQKSGRDNSTTAKHGERQGNKY
jgi:hypothetical protein